MPRGMIEPSPNLFSKGSWQISWPPLEKCLHEGQDTFVADSTAHPVHEGRVVNLVETRRDVTLDDPLIVAWIDAR